MGISRTLGSHFCFSYCNGIRIVLSYSNVLLGLPSSPVTHIAVQTRCRRAISVPSCLELFRQTSRRLFRPLFWNHHNTLYHPLATLNLQVGVKKHDSSKSDNSSLILRSVCTQPRQQSAPAPTPRRQGLAATAACTSSLRSHGFLPRISFAGLQPGSINVIHTPITDLSLGVNSITLGSLQLAAIRCLTTRRVQLARDCSPRSISQALYLLLRSAFSIFIESLLM
jgi:hypothetical protein